MTNKEIAKAFQYLGQIMELHGENPYKVRSYQNAYLTLRKLDQPLSEMTDEEIGAIKGVGKAISSKIRELLDSGRLQTIEKYEEQTPEGVRELLRIPGIGPKKIRTVWKDLGVESVGELLYAVQENRLLELKGFGEKTQADLKKKLEYYLRSKNRFRYASLDRPGRELLENLKRKGIEVAETGDFRRRCNVLPAIELLVRAEQADRLRDAGLLQRIEAQNGHWEAETADEWPVRVHFAEADEWGNRLLGHTGDEDFLQAFATLDPNGPATTEEALFERAGLPFIPPELREGDWALERAQNGNLPDLIGEKDIRGVLHAHSTYSDGYHSLEEMARYCKEQGYEYLGITDHSKAAFYANGLKADRVREQWAEIDRLNEELAPFRIFKGIESDILSDGSLDYPEEILAGFDFIIASVHSNLRMDQPKATQRLRKAIENPYTRILGHPTGRLLLSRPGYPIDHRAVIDACAEQRVAIELNANPYRLDLDWSWIPYATEKGVSIAINPDAHSQEGIHDIRYGVLSARKGGLTAANCLNAMEVGAFAKWISNR